MVMKIHLLSGKNDEQLDSADIGLKLCCLLGDLFCVMSSNQEEQEALMKLEDFATTVKTLISKNRNSNRFVGKIITGLTLIHSKLNKYPSASASNEDSASASKKAKKDFLKNLFKKGLPKPEPEPELEQQGVHAEPEPEPEPEQQGVHAEPELEPEPEPEQQGVHAEPEPIFPEGFEVEFDRDRLLSEILELINDLTSILAEIKDLCAVRKKSKVPFVLRLKKKKVLDALKTLDYQLCCLKLMKNCFRKHYDLDIKLSQLWGKGPNPYA